MFKVIKKFKDLNDGNHLYEVGDEYPRAGKKASTKRLAELSGSNNKAGVPLIEEIREDPEAPEAPEAEEEKPKKKAKKKGN